MTTTKTLTHSTAVSYETLPGFGAAWSAVIAEHQDAEWLFARSPASPEACRLAAQERLSDFTFFAELAAILSAEGKLYGVPEETLQRLSLLASGKAVVVCTGQQVGFLGGPLYTFIKAYHTVRLARALEASLKLPVLPVFWLEGEDHDLAEIQSSSFPAADGQLDSVTFAPVREVRSQEVGRYDLADRGAAALHDMIAAMGDASSEAAELLERSYRDCDLSTGMGRLLAATLGSRGLLICEGRHEGLKKLAAPLWRKTVDSAERLSQTFHARSDELRARGFQAPMSPTPDAHLFYVVAEDYARRVVHLDGTVRHPDGSAEHVSRAELLTRIESGEWQLSPKAGLRPLYQDFVLPSIAYVAGPGELEYHAQLKPFYAQLGVPAPSLFPRLSVTVADVKTDRAREKLELTWEELLTTPEHELARRLLRDADEHRTSELFISAHADIEKLFARLKLELSELDSTLEGAAASAAGRALHPLEQLQQKATKALKQRHAVELARLSKVISAVRPNGQPMERVFGTAWALLKIGLPGLLERLDRLPADGAAHHVIINE